MVVWPVSILPVGFAFSDLRTHPGSSQTTQEAESFIGRWRQAGGRGSLDKEVEGHDPAAEVLWQVEYVLFPANTYSEFWLSWWRHCRETLTVLPAFSERTHRLLVISPKQISNLSLRKTPPIDGLMQDCSIYSVITIEILQFALCHRHCTYKDELWGCLLWLF